MLHIVLFSDMPNHMRSFAEGLSADPEVRLDRAATEAEILSLVRDKCPHLVIFDSGTSEPDSLELVRKTISVNAMVNTAMVSSLSESDFHEKSEGLGILCALPPRPGAGDAAVLLQKLRAVLGR